MIRFDGTATCLPMYAETHPGEWVVSHLALGRRPAPQILALLIPSPSKSGVYGEIRLESREIVQGIRRLYLVRDVVTRRARGELRLDSHVEVPLGDGRTFSVLFKTVLDEAKRLAEAFTVIEELG